jgi:hypothetical protein
MAESARGNPLVEGAEILVAEEDAAGRLLLAARYGEEDDLQELRTLLAADPALIRAAKDSFGRGAFHMAGANGHTAVIGLLVQHCAVHAIDGTSDTTAEGNTALHYAAAANQLECCRLLLEAGWKVGAVNRLGHTVLQEVQVNGSLPEIEALLFRFDESIDRYADDRGGEEEVQLPPNLQQRSMASRDQANDEDEMQDDDFDDGPDDPCSGQASALPAKGGRVLHVDPTPEGATPVSEARKLSAPASQVPPPEGEKKSLPSAAKAKGFAKSKPQPPAGLAAAKAPLAATSIGNKVTLPAAPAKPPTTQQPAALQNLCTGLDEIE